MSAIEVQFLKKFWFKQNSAIKVIIEKKRVTDTGMGDADKDFHS